MRILIGVHQFFPRYFAGTERYALNLAKQLQRMGHYVKILTYAFRDFEAMEQRKGSKILTREYAYEGIPVLALKHAKQPDGLSVLFDFMDMDLYREVKQILEVETFDIYHCAHPLRIPSALLAAGDCGLKVVFMVTDYFMMCARGIMLRSNNTLCDGPDHGQNCLRWCYPQVRSKRMRQRMEAAQTLLQCCDQLLSPSRFLIGLFDYTGFIDPDRFLLARHGFDYEKRKKYVRTKRGETITFGYIGTLQYHKGVHIMLEAFKQTTEENIRLEVWGGAFDDVAYERSVAKLGAGDSRIEFKGAYDFNDLDGILAGIDAVLVPSIWYENAPLTISTGHAFGIPVIASDLGGMSEMVRGGFNGLTFRVGDPADLAERIRSVARDPGILSTFSRNIHYPIRLEEEAFHMEILYKKLLGTPR